MRSAAADPIPAIDLDEILEADFIAGGISGGLELELGQLGLVTSINQSINQLV